MRPIMALVAKEKENICQQYKEEFGKIVPEEVKECVFAVFDLYESNVSKAPITKEMDKYRNQIQDLQEQVIVREHEINTILSAQDLLLSEAKNMEVKITVLEAENEKLAEQLKEA